MGFGIAGIIRRTSFSTIQAASKGVEVPKGYLAVYVGDKMRRFVIPVSYLNQPHFKNYLVKPKKNSEMFIQLVVSQFHARRMSF
uniref:Auxin-induced protein 10A5 n=1 Tax=Cajanus cajan TaxID=3821 RepID=A0A151R732_CAJCA|nr:Auxin-induced protein 10A5 [Cajanus cajan]